MRWCRRKDVVGTDLDGGTVLLNMDTGKYVALNATATAIWEVLAETSSVSEVAARLVERFEIDQAAAEAATQRLLAKLADERLVEKQEV